MDAKLGPSDHRPSTEKLRAELEQGVGTCYFSDLKAHLERDALVIVADDIQLVDAGLAIAEDDAESVGYWISQGKFSKPSASQREMWQSEPTRQFRSLIVRPYVLIQALSAEPPDASPDPLDKSPEPPDK